jgi:deoxyhypusine synthase
VSQPLALAAAPSSHKLIAHAAQMKLCQDMGWLCHQAVAACADRNCSGVCVAAGVPKHHINNANLMRNGADFAVMLNTAQEFDGSDSGARPDEAISWGKIKPDAQPVKVCGDATILFPLLVSQTFYKNWDRREKEQQQAAADTKLLVKAEVTASV